MAILNGKMAFIKCAFRKITDVRHEPGSFNSCAISDMTQTSSRNIKIIKKMIMILRCGKNSSGKDLVTKYLINRQKRMCSGDWIEEGVIHGYIFSTRK